MATTSIQRLRRKIGYSLDDEVSLPEEEATDLLEEAAETYSETSSQVTYATIIYLESLLANSAKMASYRANQSQHNVSDIYEHVRDLLKYHWTELGRIQSESDDYLGAVRSGVTKQIPTRMKEYPNS